MKVIIEGKEYLVPDYFKDNCERCQRNTKFKVTEVIAYTLFKDTFVLYGICTICGKTKHIKFFHPGLNLSS